MGSLAELEPDQQRDVWRGGQVETAPGVRKTEAAKPAISTSGNASMRAAGRIHNGQSRGLGVVLCRSAKPEHNCRIERRRSLPWHALKGASRGHIGYLFSTQGAECRSAEALLYRYSEPGSEPNRQLRRRSADLAKQICELNKSQS